MSNQLDDQNVPTQSEDQMPKEQRAMTPKQAKSLIKKTVGSTNNEDIDAYKTVKDVDSKNYTSKKFIDTWESQQESERQIKKLVAILILIGLFVEMLAGNATMFFIGFGKMSIPQWVASVFFVGMYTQIITLTTIVVKNLFPAPKKDNLETLNEILKKM